jgi:hypothetical protein
MRKPSARIFVFALPYLMMAVSTFAQAPVPVPSPSSYQSPIPVVILQSPAELTIPSGTYITVEVTDRLSSDQSHTDDAFTAILHQPIVVDGWVVARAGQPVIGHVVSVQKSGHTQGKSSIGIELIELVLVDGQQVSIRTQMIRNQASTSTDRDFAAIAATTGLGALIGAGVAGGSGAAIGAGIGAGAGVAGVLATPGESAQIQPERVLAFRLDEPVAISTARSPHAFLAVNPADFRAVSVPVVPVVEQPVLYAAPAPPVVVVPYGYPRRYYRF